LVIGGQTIQDECYQTLKTRGNQLSEGDILVSGAGQLPCKAVIHAVGPVFRGGHSGEEDCLHETIMKCMGAATEAGYTSIAFPAISTGIFQYPSKKATLVITEAIKTYFLEKVKELKALPVDEMLDQRYKRLTAVGAYSEK